MKRQKNKKRWMRKRHVVVRNIVYYFIYLYSIIKFGVKIEKFKEQNGRQFLIVMNHQTVFDQFFVSMTFKGAVYYIATEDLFSNGWISKLIRFLVAPIPIKKQTTDVRAVLNCIRVAKEGATIALAPEGNRTYSGKTEYIKPSIIGLMRKLELPIAIFRIEGGYGVQPRWSDVIRRGKMRTYVSRVIEPEEYKELTNDEFYNMIVKELYVNEAVIDGEYHHKKCAEYLERAVYVCPFCGLSEFESHNDIIDCKYCGRQIRYLPTKELLGINFDFPFRFFAEWYDYQADYVSKLDYTQYLTVPMYHDTAKLSEVILYKSKKLLLEYADLYLYGDRVIIKNNSEEYIAFPFENTQAITVLGRNKLNIYFDGHVYQFKGSKRFNALKYVNLYYHYKNVREGKVNGKFLGI